MPKGALTAWYEPKTPFTSLSSSFGVQGTPADALAQIKEKGYAVPYLSSGKRIIIIGASFDEEKRNIGAWETEEIFATVEKD